MPRLKPRPIGSSHEALARFFEAIGIKRAADFEDKSPSTIYNELNPDLPGEISFARVARLTEHFRDLTAADFLARKGGAIVVPLPVVAAAEDDATALVASAKASADAIALGWSARADGVITPGEKAALKENIRRAVASFVSLDLWLDGENGE